MALENIIKKIRENTEKKVEELKLKFEREKTNLISITEKKLEEIKHEIQQELEKKILIEKNRLTTAANIELNKTILLEKHKLIDKVFSEAYKKILNLSISEYKKFILPLILNNINTGNEEIFLPAKYYNEFGQELLKEINTHIRSKSINSSIKVKPGTIDSGFVIKSNKKELNATLEAIFTKLHEKLDLEVNKILFKNARI